MDNNSDTIIINKYSSRRLYNTNSSEYVTLDDLCKLINDGKNFKIIDKDSGKDITNQYLLQIISDLENKEGNVFPQDVLKEIILSYNNTAQKFMPEILSKTFEVFHQQQQSFLKAFNSPAEENKSSESSAVFFEEWQKSQAEIMEKMMQPWLNNPLFKEKTSGKYIVQFIIFERNKSEKIRDWWEKKCIEKCSNSSNETLVGDQAYLNDWDTRFKDEVHILKNNDLFRSTWNSKKLKLPKLIAWHFHGLRIINKKLVLMHTEKNLSENILSEIYLPYLKILEKNLKIINIQICQMNNKNSILMKFLLRLNLFLIEKKLIKNKRYFKF